MFIRYFSKEYPEGSAIRFALKNIFKDVFFFIAFSLFHSLATILLSILVLFFSSLFDFSGWSFKLFGIFGKSILLFQNISSLALVLSLLIIFKLFFLLGLNGFVLRKVLTKKNFLLDFFFTFRFIKEAFIAYLTIAILFFSLSSIYFSVFFLLRIFTSKIIFDLSVFLFVLLSLYFLIRLAFIPQCLISFGSSAFLSIKQSWKISNKKFFELTNFLLLLLGFYGIFLLCFYFLGFVFKQIISNENFSGLISSFFSFLTCKLKFLIIALIESDFSAQKFLLTNQALLKTAFHSLKSFLLKSLFLDLFFSYLALALSRIFCSLYFGL